MKLLDIGKIKRGTNILNVIVPQELRIKHKVGIEWIDFVLGGGFTPSTVTMLTGDPGCGKSTCLRTIADALTGQGHAVLYNCGEESEFQTKMACERLRFTNGFTYGDDVFVDAIIAHADFLGKKLPSGKRVFLFVDSLQECDDGAYDTGKRTKRTPVNCAIKLIEWAKRTMNVVVFINQVRKDGVFVGDNQLLHAVDAHVHFGFDKDKKSPTHGERVLTVKKNRFASGAVAPVCIEMVEGGRLLVKVIDESEADKDDLDEAAE